MRLVLTVCIALLVAGCASKSESDQPSVDPALAKILYAGEVVFIENCGSCHKADSLNKSPIVTGDKSLLLAVHPFDSLEAEDVASVLTFIRNSFGNKADMITIEDVKNFKNPPLKNQ